MKRRFSILLALVVLFSVLAVCPVSAAQDISVYIDGKPVSFPSPPIAVNGTTLVPMRAMFEALGAEVDWDNELQTAYGFAPGVYVALTIGSPTMNRNFVDVPLAEPAQLVNGNTFIPLRAVSECFDMKVDWDGASNSIIMTSLGNIIERDWNDNYIFIGEAGASSSGGYGILYDKVTREPSILGYFEYNSLKEGYGEHYYPSGAYYIGEWKNDVQEGYGEYHLADGTYFIGEFKNGNVEGYIEFHSVSGDYFIGEYKNGLLDGPGEYHWADGSYYTGDFKNGLKDGYGELHSANGASYIGEWKNDVKEGHGEYRYANGDYDIGEFKNNVLNGSGERHWANGDYYIGEFKNNIIEGYGEYHWPDGDYYIGEYKNDVKEGYGEYHWADGDYYIGEWTNDVKHGYGTYFFANGTSKAGYWYNGEFVDTSTTTKNPQTQTTDNTTTPTSTEKGVCAFGNCTNKLTRSNTIYCWKHSCHELGCVYPICNTYSNYCIYHKCAVNNCYKGKHDGSDYCFNHKCMNYGCNNKRDGSSSYCSEHSNSWF